MKVKPSVKKICDSCKVIRRHGRVMVICVGAMMVGSTVITRQPGEKVSRGEELGYFKFGGSTLLVLFEDSVISFDSDLVENSRGPLETLVRPDPSSLFFSSSLFFVHPF